MTVLSASLKYITVIIFVLMQSGPVFASETMPPVITHVRITNAVLYKKLIIHAQIDDQSLVFAPSLYYRSFGDTEYLSIPMKEVDGRYIADIDGAQLTGDLEYFIEAFDEHGNGPSRDGTPDFPIRITVEEAKPSEPVPALVPVPSVQAPVGILPNNSVSVPKADKLRLESVDSSIHEQWWFWALVSAVALAGGTAAVLIGQSSNTPDSVRLTVKGPSPYEGLP